MHTHAHTHTSSSIESEYEGQKRPSSSCGLGWDPGLGFDWGLSTSPWPWAWFFKVHEPSGIYLDDCGQSTVCDKFPHPHQACKVYMYNQSVFFWGWVQNVDPWLYIKPSSTPSICLNLVVINETEMWLPSWNFQKAFYFWRKYFNSPHLKLKKKKG